MSMHVVYRLSGVVEEFEARPADETLASDSVTVTLSDGSLRSYHSEEPLGGVAFEFADSGVLVLRFVESDHLVLAFAPGAWTTVTGSALGDRGRRSSSGR